jgi:hypothetical protein
MYFDFRINDVLFYLYSKLDLLIINGEDSPAVVVTHKGIKAFTGKVPENKRDAKNLDMELVYLTSIEVFG